MSGLLNCIDGKPGISITADRGFTIKGMLDNIGVTLNIPLFMEGRKQLPASEVSEGRKIASVMIHVERVIGRIKSFQILKHTIPKTLATLPKQIVTVCAFLLNFKPVLILPAELHAEDEFGSSSDVEDYFAELSETEDSDDEA